MKIGVFCSPRSFFAGDVLIDILSAIIVFIIAIYAFRLYKCKKPYQHCKTLAMFGTALIALGSSFVIRIITYYNLVMSGNGSAYRHMLISISDLESILFLCGFISYRLLTVTGFFIIYCIAFRKDSWLSKSLVFLLLFANTVMLKYYVSQTFYLTNMLLLAVISLKYREQFLVSKNKNTRLVAISFMLLSASYFFIMISEWYTHTYILSRIIWLGSFILLLWSFIKVLKHGKKTDKT